MMNYFAKNGVLWARIKTAYRVLRYPGQYLFLDKKRYAYHQMSFAQEGEDMILARMFDLKKTPGFYVDIGAHHPQRFSNTYHYYLRGWRGINIDPLPGCMKLFNQVRPEDINLELAISDVSGEITYYQFNEPALNTFDREIAEERDGLKEYRIVAKCQISTRCLSQVLQEHLPTGQIIDFMTVDAEGFDMKVLASNDWDKYRPAYVLVESLGGGPLIAAASSPVTQYMDTRDYELCAKAFNTLIFRRR